MPGAGGLNAAALLARFLVYQWLLLKSFINQINHRYESFEIEYHRISIVRVGCGHCADLNAGNIDYPCSNHHAAVDISGQYHPAEDGSGQHSSAVDITGRDQAWQHHYPAIVNDGTGWYGTAFDRAAEHRTVQHHRAWQYDGTKQLYNAIDNPDG